MNIEHRASFPAQESIRLSAGQTLVIGPIGFSARRAEQGYVANMQCETGQDINANWMTLKNPDHGRNVAEARYDKKHTISRSVSNWSVGSGTQNQLDNNPGADLVLTDEAYYLHVYAVDKSACTINAHVKSSLS